MLEKDIFVRTHLHTSQIVVRIGRNRFEIAHVLATDRGCYISTPGRPAKSNINPTVATNLAD